MWLSKWKILFCERHFKNGKTTHGLELIFAKHISDRRLISRIYINNLKFNDKEIITQFFKQ